MAGSIGTAYFNVAPNMSGVQGKVTSGLKGTGAQFAEQFGGEINGKSAFIVGAIAGIASAATTKAMSILSNSIDTAVKRVDTLNSAEKTFSYMGFAAQDSSEAVKAVTKSIQGLPTPLDSAIRGMTGLAATYGDVKLGQKVFSALNNAVLGFGGSSAMVDNAIQQLSQLPMDGPLDAQTWNSLRNSGITPVLVAMGKDMGKSVSTLKEEFGNGTLKVQDFVNELIKLDTQGGGGLVSLQKIAQNATSGISTGFANMQTAVARGMANIIQAVGQKNISNAIAQIGAGFEKVLNFVAKNIPVVVAEIKTWFDYVNRNKDIFYPIAVGIGAIVTAIVAWKTALLIWSGVTKTAIAVQAAFNAVLAINPITAIALAIVGLVAGLTYFFTQTKTGQAVWASFTAFLETAFERIKVGITAIGNFFTSVWAKIMTGAWAVRDAFNATTAAVTNFISAGINVLNSAAQATLKWLYDWRTWFINIGIVIGTILLPKMIQLGIEALKSGAMWVKSMLQAGAATSKTAAQAVVDFVKMSVAATVNAAKAGYAWTVAAAQATAAWIKSIPSMIAQFYAASVAAVTNAAKSGAAWVAASYQTLVSWGATFAAYLAGVAAAATQTLIAGARMAAGWLLALGPIGLIIAVVAGAVALIIANWDSVSNFVVGVWHRIQDAVSTVINWITQNWKLLLAIITGPIGLAVYYVINNFQQIKDAVAGVINSVVSFFSQLPGRIMSVLGGMGSMLYGVGRDMIQGLLNGAGSLLSSIGSFFLNKLPGWIQDPFKKALGIRSPSRVFAGFGANISQGLANGVANNASAVTGAISDLADSAMNSFGSNGLTADIAAKAAPGAASAYSTNGAAGSSTSSENTFTGNIILGSADAVKEMFKQLNQDTMNVGIGLTPNQGAI